MRAAVVWVQQQVEGATDASPAQNLVRTHLEVVEVPQPMGLVAEHSR